MNYSIIFTAIFAVITLGCALCAFWKPMKVNVWHAICLVFSLLVSVILEIAGVFTAIGSKFAPLVMKVSIIKKLTANSTVTAAFLEKEIGVIASVFLFTVVFFLLLLITRIVVRACKFFPGFMNFGAYAKTAPAGDGEEGAKKEKPAKPEKEAWGLRGGSAAIGLVCGFLVCAVLFVPFFYIESIVDSAVEASAVTEKDEVGLREGVAKVGVMFDEAYSNSFAAKTYKTLGIAGLMNGMVDSTAVIDVDGEKCNTSDTLRNLLKNGTYIAYGVFATTEDDKALESNFDALANDKIMVSILTEFMESEAKALKDGKKGILVKEKAKAKDDMVTQIIASFTGCYADATTAAKKQDAAAFFAGLGDLAAVDFYNEFLTALEEGGSTEITDMLLGNLASVGRVLDALHNADADHTLAANLLGSMAGIEAVSKYLSEDTLTQLNADVAAGKTTYYAFTATLQSLLECVQ